MFAAILICGLTVSSCKKDPQPTPTPDPAQALFNIIGYDIHLHDLCAQGCFGKLPAHMPAQSTITTSIPIPGFSPLVVTSNYTYTVDAEGRLATCVGTSSNEEDTSNYTFNWEEL